MIRRIALLLICLASAQAWGATKWFDAYCATPGDGTTSFCTGATAPFDQFSDTTISANDTLNCTGVFNEQISSTNVSGVTITPYGSGCIIDGQNVRDYGILNDRGSNWTINGIEIRNALKNAIKIFTLTGSTTITGTTLNDTILHDIGPGIYPAANEAEFEVGTCLLVRTSTSSTAIVNGVTVNRVKAYDCGKHGMDFRFQVKNILIDGAEVYANGGTATGHGISFHPWKETYTGVTTAGWVATAGGVYTMNRKSNNDSEQLVIDQTNHIILTKNTATPKTPALNEWGVVAGGGGGDCPNNATTGCLYARITGDADPDTVTMAVKRFPHGPIMVKNSYAHDNLSGVDTAEGHGFDADDLTGPITFQSNLSENNYGSGFQAFYSEQANLIGNISRKNGKQGFFLYNCSICKLISNAADQNGDLGAYDGGVTTLGLVARNNAFTNNITRGAGVSNGTAAASGFSSAANISFGNGANGCNNLTCTTTDPQYIGGTRPTDALGYCPKSGSLLIRAGSGAGGLATDHMGTLFEMPNPTIGPLSTANCQSGARTVSTSRTARQ